MDGCGLLCLGGRRKEPSSARQPTPGDSSHHVAAAPAFSFKELSAATSEFSEDCRVGRGLYKGYLKGVNQARPLLKDRRQFPGMADPAMQGRYPRMGLQESLEVASMCLRESPATRPTMGTVAAALARLADDPAEPHDT
ncbi:unnamed protein product [Alopecurus aequalis]